MSETSGSSMCFCSGPRPTRSSMSRAMVWSSSDQPLARRASTSLALISASRSGALANGSVMLVSRWSPRYARTLARISSGDAAPTPALAGVVGAILPSAKPARQTSPKAGPPLTALEVGINGGSQLRDGFGRGAPVVQARRPVLIFRGHEGAVSRDRGRQGSAQVGEHLFWVEIATRLVEDEAQLTAMAEPAKRLHASIGVLHTAGCWCHHVIHAMRSLQCICRQLVDVAGKVEEYEVVGVLVQVHQDLRQSLHRQCTSLSRCDRPGRSEKDTQAAVVVGDKAFLYARAVGLGIEYQVPDCWMSETYLHRNVC